VALDKNGNINIRTRITKELEKAQTKNYTPGKKNWRG